ncbi:MAG: hypothetical protein KKD50_03120, partial [Proteobacteria bacterium]|nr:hypothetical protein [Pseudomonadota bacterium]
LEMLLTHFVFCLDLKYQATYILQKYKIFVDRYFYKGLRSSHHKKIKLNLQGKNYELGLGKT